jgi:hypothetical protein
MKNNVLTATILMICVHFGCDQSKFKTVHSEKAPYSISVPKDYDPPSENDPVKSSQYMDLRYQRSKAELIATSVIDITAEDAGNFIKQFINLSDTDFAKKLDADNDSNIKILERKTIDVNSIPAYYVYYKTDRLYYQVLFLFNNYKMVHLLCSYEYRAQDSLRPFFYQVVNSVSWGRN